jgi:hypothetical protein
MPGLPAESRQLASSVAIDTKGAVAARRIPKFADAADLGDAAPSIA